MWLYDNLNILVYDAYVLLICSKFLSKYCVMNLMVSLCFMMYFCMIKRLRECEPWATIAMECDFI